MTKPVEIVKYKKENGEVHKKEIIIISKPSPHYLTLEVTGISPVLLHEIQQELERHSAKLKELGVQWRRLDPAKMEFAEGV